MESNRLCNYFYIAIRKEGIYRRDIQKKGWNDLNTMSANKKKANAQKKDKKYSIQNILFVVITNAAGGIISAIIMTVAASIFLSITGFFDTIKRIPNIEENIQELQDEQSTMSIASDQKMTEIDEAIKEIEQYAVHKDSIEEIQSDIKKIYYILGETVGTLSILPDKNLVNLLSITYASDDDVCKYADMLLFDDSSEVIGTNTVTGAAVTVQELENLAILTCYMENNEEVYFLGGYDELHHWDGHCTINRYKDNKLMQIMEADYDSGKLLKYRQVSIYTNASGKDVWWVAERGNEGDLNKGQSWSYNKDSDIVKEFGFDSVSLKDILNIDTFDEKNNLLLEGYYSEYILNGDYSDDTGNQYMIKYNEEGYIRYMYMGDFKDGLPDDSSGDAWSIGLGIEDTDHYYYYKGTFTAGKHGEVKGTWNPIAEDEINKIMEKYKIPESLLKWLELGDT